MLEEFISLISPFLSTLKDLLINKNLTENKNSSLVLIKKDISIFTLELKNGIEFFEDNNIKSFLRQILVLIDVLFVLMA